MKETARARSRPPLILPALPSGRGRPRPQVPHGTAGVLATTAWSSFKLLRVAIADRHQLDEFIGLIVLHYLWFSPTTLLVSGVVWGFLGNRVWRGIQRHADLRLGWRGETAVGEALSHRKVANVALAVFHDVPGDGAWNIDHVVVTRAAVFLIETKTRTKRTGRNSLEADTVECQGETLRFPYWNDEQTVAQAERNARWLRRMVGTLVPPSYPIQALIVLPGWNVRNPERLKIPAMRANDLVQYIAQQAANPSNDPDESALKPLIKALDDRCRTVEF